MDILDQLVGDIKENLSAKTFDEMDEFTDINTWVSTGVPELDLLLNTFGYNPGFIEVIGKSRSGKTTLGLTLIRQSQESNSIVAIISTERRDSKTNAEAMGINTKRVIIKKTKTIEGIFYHINKIIDRVRSGEKFHEQLKAELSKAKTKKAKDEIKKKYEEIFEFCKKVQIVIMVDSLGATPSKAELDAEVKAQGKKKGTEDDKDKSGGMAIAARVTKGKLRTTIGKVDDENVIVYVCNHVYEQIGVMFGKKTKGFGGEGLRFYSQIRLELTNIGTLKIGSGEKIKKIGQVTQFEILKSDFCMPLQKIEVEMLWGIGYVPGKDILELAVKEGVLERSGLVGYSIKKFKNYSWKNREELYEKWAQDMKFRNLLNKLLINMVHKIVRKRRGIQDAEKSKGN